MRCTVNFNKFREFYDLAKGNAIEALYQTPAGKVAKKYGLKPTDIKIGETNISVTWIKE